MDRIRVGMAAAVLVLVAACSVIGLTPASSFSEKLAYAYGSHAGIQTAAASALDAKRITVADAEQVLKIADEARTILDAARAASAAGDATSAEGRLNLALSLLRELDAYLKRPRGSTGVTS